MHEEKLREITGVNKATAEPYGQSRSNSGPIEDKVDPI